VVQTRPLVDCAVFLRHIVGTLYYTCATSFNLEAIMSAGAFEIGRYINNDAVVFGCRPQPETKALVIATITNAYPVGAVTAPVQARLSGGKRRIGMTARTVTLNFTGAPPAGYSAGRSIRVPCFAQAIYNAATFGAVGTYLGAAVAVVGRSPERIR